MFKFKEFPRTATAEERSTFIKGFMDCCYSSFYAELENSDIQARLDPYFLINHPLKSLSPKDHSDAIQRSLEILSTDLEDASQNFAVIIIDPAFPHVVVGASLLTISPADEPACEEDVEELDASWSKCEDRQNMVASILKWGRKEMANARKHRRVVTQTFAVTQSYNKREIATCLANWGVETAEKLCEDLLIVTAPACISFYQKHGFSLILEANFINTKVNLSDELAFLVKHALPVNLRFMTRS